MMNAIGMIETKGLLAAIEGADVMLKAADVTLLDKSSATGGLITITVTGEVSAVQAAIEAATVAINRLNSNLLISKHVIARPSSSLEKVMSIMSSTPQNESAKDVEKEHLPAEETPVSAKETPITIEESTIVIKDAPVVVAEAPVVAELPIVVGSPVAEAASVIEDVPVPKSVEDTVSHYRASKLQKMNLNNLREIASELPELNTNIDIKKATKKTLIKVIRDSQINKGRK
ncbi:BMC domain-containing protein [Moritella yayanosii]|nr:BMC domain-containing protein [Moritella yayanosii]